MSKDKRELWVERIITGISAVIGILAVIAACYAGLAMLWLVMKAPDAFAIVAGAGIIGTALYLKKPAATYLLNMGHPDAVAIMNSIKRIVEERETHH